MGNKNIFQLIYSICEVLKCYIEMSVLSIRKRNVFLFVRRGGFILEIQARSTELIA